jgi:hypothetical protein
MKKTVGVLVVMALLAVTLVAVTVGVWISTHNREAALRAEFDAQQQSIEASFDRVWKVISQSGQVAAAERETFRNTYVEIMDATKGVVGDGKLVSGFSQAGISISPDLYKQLQQTVEAQRDGFFRDQQRLLDIQRQHKTLLNSVAGLVFCAGRTPVEAKLITSTRASEVFNSGKEDDIAVPGM